MVACTGPPATRSCEPRQARKGAAVAMDAGAGARRVNVQASHNRPALIRPVTNERPLSYQGMKDTID